MWGIPGAFVGVPILIAVIAYCGQEPSSRWIAVLLSGNDVSRNGNAPELGRE
jgi:predicted PurR-regulated permease PerM